MIEQSDIQGRLRLFRYGLIVIVVVTFLVSLLAPFSRTNIDGVATPPITDFLGTALLFTVVVAVLAVIVYFVYARVLQNTVGDDKS